MNVNEFISIDPDICFGKPHIKGTRIKVSFILELISSGWTMDQILQEYDHLSRDQVTAALIYAGHHLDACEKKVEISDELNLFFIKKSLRALGKDS